MFTNAYVRMKQLNMVAKPAQVEVRLFGDDIDTLKNYGNQIIDLSRETPQTIWSRTNYGEMQHTVAIDVNEEEALFLDCDLAIIVYLIIRPPVMIFYCKNCKYSTIRGENELISKTNFFAC